MDGVPNEPEPVDEGEETSSSLSSSSMCQEEEDLYDSSCSESAMAKGIESAQEGDTQYVPLEPWVLALSNPTVLQEILKSGCSKEMRLVSKLWNHIILSLHTPKLLFSLQKGPSPVAPPGAPDPITGSNPTCCQIVPLQQLMDTMDPKLARCVAVNDSCFVKGGNLEQARGQEGHSVSQAGLCTTANLLHFGSRFSNTIQILRGKGTQQLAQPLFKILRDFCPNVKEVRLEINWGKDSFRIRQQEALETADAIAKPIPIKSKLKTIFMKGSGFVSVQSAALQELIRASPNLEKLTVIGNFYPDLQVNGRLKCLYYCGVISSYLTLPHPPINTHSRLGKYKFSASELSRMLDQVKLTLEKLRLEVYNFDEDCLACKRKSKHFKLPEMPRLKVLKNRTHVVLKCGDGLEDIACDRMPQLNTLKISRNRSKLGSLQVLLNKTVERECVFDGMKKLQIHGIENFTIITKLKPIFPSLQEFEVVLYLINEDYTDALVQSAIEGCSTLTGLKRLKISIPFGYKLSSLITALCQHRNSYFQGSLENLKIVNKTERPVGGEMEDDRVFGKLFEALLLYTKNMKCVEFKHFMLHAATAQRIFNGIIANRLPVKFTR